MAFSTKFDSIDGFTLTRVCGTNDCRCLYDCDEVNAKGERLFVEVTSTEHQPQKKGSLMWHWLREGRLSKPLDRTYTFHCYVECPDGHCRERYNPTIKESEDGGRYVTDFDWMDEATEDHARRVFAEIRRRFMAA